MSGCVSRLWERKKGEERETAAQIRSYAKGPKNRLEKEVIYRITQKGFIQPSNRGKLKLGHDPATISDRYKSVAFGAYALVTAPTILISGELLDLQLARILGDIIEKQE